MIILIVLFNAPGKNFKRKGFTLIEVLVVVAIIAILAILGLALFGNVQRNARDGRRRSDINAIAKAMEANYTSSGFQTNIRFGQNLLVNIASGRYKALRVLVVPHILP